MLPVGSNHKERRREGVKGWKEGGRRESGRKEMGVRVGGKEGGSEGMDVCTWLSTRVVVFPLAQAIN